MIIKLIILLAAALHSAMAASTLRSGCVQLTPLPIADEVLLSSALAMKNIRKVISWYNRGNTARDACMLNEPQDPIHPVQALHESTPNGVRFNVQTVDQLGKPLAPKHDGETLEQEATSRFYGDDVTSTKVEVSSLKGTKFSGRGGLAQAVGHAFAQHYPLVIRPDDVWMLINYAFVRHVDDNAEALRSNFVSHQGKKDLVVQIDHFRRGRTPASLWERDVFPEFSRQIGEYIGEPAHSTLAKGFSTSTRSDRAANEITLMAAMKNYFIMIQTTTCGIPWIELRGTLEDWIDLRRRTDELGCMMLPDFSKSWLTHLLPVLDEFVASYSGDVNHYFWQGIYKRVPNRYSCSDEEIVSGWIPLLYPYLANDRVNRHMKPWRDMVDSKSGPQPDQLPVTMVSSVPVLWIYFLEEFKLHFHAGFFGFVQDNETLAIRSVLSWAVTYDPEGFGER